MAAEQQADSLTRAELTERSPSVWRKLWRRPTEDGIPVVSWEVVGYTALLLTAAVMRLWDLGSRAMHHDESLHAFYSWQLYNGSGFQHIPMMHGPFQFEANAAIFFVFGDSDFTSRLLYALAGTILVGLPFLLRNRLGRLGALLVAGMLAFSPALLYFSRFARNDILMAVWTLGLVISMWRYMDEGKNRYLYLSAAILALLFATKETAYILTAILGLYLTLLVTPENWDRIRRTITVQGVATPVAIGRVAAGIWSAVQRGVRLSEVSRPTCFLILLLTLTLPQWSALVSLFQDTPLFSWSNLVLASATNVGPGGGPVAIGAPVGGGLVIAALVVIVLVGASIYWGYRWNWPVWWRSALIFYSVWVLLYTTFFTNQVGIGSGIWQSLGYWAVQQGEARGGQPWYYYFVITSIYEFLPLIFGFIAAVYYMRRRDLFGQFLVFWSVATFILYTLASEKMPWLTVNLTLPLIVLSGKFLADVIGGIEWRRLVSNWGLLALPGVPLFLFALWQLAFFEAGSDAVANTLVPLSLATALLLMVASGVHLARRSGARNIAAMAAISTAAVLLGLSIRSGWIASYRNGDTPVEMIVYVQTSPEISRLVREIESAGYSAGHESDLPTTIDSTSGFSWPWAWYLRDQTGVSYPCYEDDPNDPGCAPMREAPDSSALLVHSRNQPDADPLVTDLYGQAERIRHRWWFPEETTYRDLTVAKFLRGLADRRSWRSAMDYFLYREGVRERLGSEDAYLYRSKALPRGS